MKNAEFVEKIGYIIQEEAFKRGYEYPSAIIAQACLESAYGRSQLGKKYNNFFGLKCGKSWKGESVNLKTKEEYQVGTKVEIKDNFRCYDGMTEGVIGYFEFISTKRYSNLRNAKSPEDYLTMIKNDGYATSSTYVKDVTKVIDANDLRRFDKKIIVSNNVPVESLDEVARDVINGKYGNGANRRIRLKRAGYNYNEVQKRVNEIIGG